MAKSEELNSISLKVLALGAQVFCRLGYAIDLFNYLDNTSALSRQAVSTI